MNEHQPSQMVKHARTDSLDSPQDEFLRVSKLLTVLSNPDALVIFSLAKDGIEADMSAYSRINLTRRKYYARLTQLKNAGLIEKRGNFYFQTTMGSFLHENCINPVIYAVKNSKQIAMIDVLKNKMNFSNEDLQRMKNATCGMPPGGTDLRLHEILGSYWGGYITPTIF